MLRSHRFACLSFLVCATAVSALSGCATISKLSGGRIPIGNESGGGGEAANSNSSSSSTSSSGGSSSGAAAAPKSRGRAASGGGEEGEPGCTAWIAKQRSEADAIAQAAPTSVADAKALAARWKDVNPRPTYECSCQTDPVQNASGGTSLKYRCKEPKAGEAIEALQADTAKMDFAVNEKIVRAALKDDPMWARGQMFQMFRDDDRVPNEALRTLGHDVAKAYEAYLSAMFKANGGLGKKDNGQVMCVYSTKPLSANGSGSTGFQTHFDGPVTVNVGCRLQSPANASNGHIILYFNADTGPMESQLFEVDLGHSSSVGAKDWITGSFKLPAGKDFTQTVHYTFDARVVLRNVWNEESVMSSAVFTWHK